MFRVRNGDSPSTAVSGEDVHSARLSDVVSRPLSDEDGLSRIMDGPNFVGTRTIPSSRLLRVSVDDAMCETNHSEERGRSVTQHFGREMSGRIFWLASYPKSGNTWLRVFLANYLADGERPIDINTLPRFAESDAAAWLFERALRRPFSDLSAEEIHGARPLVHALIAQTSGDIALAKTHSALVQIGGVPSITPQLTAGAIYVVRNPLDVVPSWAVHFGCSIDDAIDALGSPRTELVKTASLAGQFVGNWSSHVHDWTTARSLSPIVLRYEDMLSTPIETFSRVLRHLRQKVDARRVERAVDRSSFSKLVTQEKQRGFAERPSHASIFFRSGSAGMWRQTLTSEQVERVAGEHRVVMAEHGYLHTAASGGS